ncbi:serine/threonine protein kinase [Thermoleophilia bacterium SCSIO 60948]|nr:serine/threonine protein kinase [Thermoleophilia bacterium SCSIO 60948]
MSSEMAQLEPGSDFAGHRIVAELGRGPLGVVFRARHLALDRDAALKVFVPAISDREGPQKRLRREAAAAARIHHPGVAAVHNAGVEDGRAYLAMELVDGPDLRDVIEHEGALEPDLVAEIVTEIAAALDAAHAREVLHRDLKPSNVLLDRDGRARIVDFGATAVAGPDAALDPELPAIGDPDFMAPEQIGSDESGKPADIYALGAIAHFLLTAEDPFPNRSPAAKLVAAALAARPEPSAVYDDLSRQIDVVIARAMAIDPAERYASGRELASELSAAIGAETDPQRAPDTPAEPAAAASAPAAVEAEPDPEPAPVDEPEDGGEIPEDEPAGDSEPPSVAEGREPTGLEQPLKIAIAIVLVLVILLALILLLL